MELGGVMLAAGMVLEVQAKDYLYGEGLVRLTVGEILEVREDWNCQWVVLTGQEKVPQGPWRARRIQIRVSALKTALSLTGAA